MEPAGTQRVAGREHDHECDEIEGRLVGEESIRLDSENESVDLCFSWGLVRCLTPRLWQPPYGIVPLPQHLS